MWGMVMETAKWLMKHELTQLVLFLALLILLGWTSRQGYLWASEEHADLVNKTEFAELKVKMENGFEATEINDSTQTIRLLKIDLRIATATGASEGELRSMQEALDSAKAYKNCLVHREPNCEHLKNPE